MHLGILLGFIAGGLIGQAYGWRIAFMAVGIPGILLALVLLLTVKEPQRGRWETAVEAAYKPTMRETIKLLSAYKSFWYLAAATALAAFAGYGTGNFSPSYLIRNHGFSCG